MDKINVEQLINEVHMRPALWDMKLSDYSDRLKRKLCWEEISDIFATEDMTEKERKELGK